MSRYAQKLQVGTWLLLVTMLIALIFGYMEFQNLVECVNDTTAGQRARAEATEKSDAAVDEMVEGVLGADSSADSRAALERYASARADVKRIRRENPLPSPDKC